MWSAINETPDVIERCLKGEVSARAVLVGQEIARRKAQRAVLFGCGTSYFAALSTAYALADVAGMEADSYDAFELLKYRLKTVLPGTVCMGFSHSGRTRVTVDALWVLKDRGFPTVALTDIPGSLLTQAGDFLVDGGAGPEPVEPKTRSYINALVMGYQIAAAVKGDEEARREIATIPSLLRETRGIEGEIRHLAERYSGHRRVFVVGAGPNSATAREVALKFKETVLFASEGMEVEEALHGPVASIDEKTLVIAVNYPGPGYEKVLDFCKVSLKLGAPVICVTSRACGPEPSGLTGPSVGAENPVCNRPDRLAGLEGFRGFHTLVVPSGVREAFSGALLVYPLYMLVYFIAMELGANPDRMRMGDPAFEEAMRSIPSITY